MQAHGRLYHNAQQGCGKWMLWGQVSGDGSGVVLQGCYLIRCL